MRLLADEDDEEVKHPRNVCDDGDRGDDVKVEKERIFEFVDYDGVGEDLDREEHKRDRQSDEEVRVRGLGSDPEANVILKQPT